MQEMTRRYFCGASVLALPAVRVFAGAAEEPAGEGFSDPVLDVLADEFARTTADGAEKGFGSAQFLQYAGQVRLFDALLEDKGTNAKMDHMLDEDDYYLIDPYGNADIIGKYWKRRGILFDETQLIRMASLDERSYRRVKREIKKQGGVRALHQKAAAVFERKAREYASVGFGSGLTMHGGFVRFPARPRPAPADFLKNVQLEMFAPLDPALNGGEDYDCLCKALKVEGAALSILCASICQPCCVPAAIMLALVTLMESFDFCNPENC
jgi:hypothetical protein